VAGFGLGVSRRRPTVSGSSDLCVRDRARRGEPGWFRELVLTATRRRTTRRGSVCRRHEALREYRTSRMTLVASLVIRRQSSRMPRSSTAISSEWNQPGRAELSDLDASQPLSTASPAGPSLEDTRRSLERSPTLNPNRWCCDDPVNLSCDPRFVWWTIVFKSMTASR
jgi:hypothetical protein